MRTLKMVYSCNNCKGQVETPHHCAVCSDFDLCTQCYENNKKSHPHEMKKLVLGLNLNHASSSVTKQANANPQDARKLSIQLGPCPVTSSQTKRVSMHKKECKLMVKTNGVCPICKQRIALCQVIKHQLRSPASLISDSQKQKFVKQQLVFLLHAYKCDHTACPQSTCKTMKTVLNHMTMCQAGKNCKVPQCSSSRKIVSHWKHCGRNDCPICAPLKQADKNRNLPKPTTSTPQGIYPKDMRKATTGPGPTRPAAPAPGPIAGHQSQRPGQRMPINTVSPINNKSAIAKETPIPIEQCIKTLVHASQCSTSCSLPNCSRMKGIVMHHKLCKVTIAGGCSICKQLLTISSHHSKQCQGTKCPVPFCTNIKLSLKQQQLQKRSRTMAWINALPTINIPVAQTCDAPSAV